MSRKRAYFRQLGEEKCISRQRLVARVQKVRHGRNIANFAGYTRVQW